MSGSDRYSYRRMGSKVIHLACLVLLSFFACFAVKADEPPAWSTRMPSSSRSQSACTTAKKS